MSDVQPFQFEPTYPLGEEPIDFAEEREEGAAATDFAARIGNTESRGGVLGKILMGVCRWDSETLNLYQTTFMSFLQPYSRLDAKNPYPIPD